MFILYNVAFFQHLSTPRWRVRLGVRGCMLFYKLLHLGCSLCALSLHQSRQRQLSSCSNSHTAFTWHTISRTTYSLRLPPMDFALIGGLNFSMAMLVSPAVTIIARKYGTQLPMLLGLGLLASGYVSASFSQRIWQLYLSQGVLIGFGVGFIYIPSIPVLSQWFDKKRSLANGISAAGSGIGGLIFSLWMVQSFRRYLLLGLYDLQLSSVARY
jgi:Major Facilitator Superfamily.